jgi:hypothetical protein
MTDYTETPSAWAMTNGMAWRAGLDLRAAVLEGWLRRNELAEIVDRCQSGGCRQACLQWFGVANPAATPPNVCAIGAEIAALAPET